LTFFKSIYILKQKFNENDQDQLSDWISALQNKASSMTLNSQSREYADQRIKGSAMDSFHKVSDARDSKIINAGLDKWTDKQMGFTWAEGK